MMWLAESRSFVIVALLFIILFAAQSLWLHKAERVRTSWLTWFLVAAILAGGWLLAEQAGNQEKNRVRTLILTFARIYADEIEAEGHWTLPSNVATNDPLYLRLIDMEKRWLAMNPDAHDIYTFRKRADGKYFFLVDSETDYNHDGKYSGEREQRTPIGELYDKADPGLDLAFRGSANFEFTPITDRWGTWVSAFVPLCNPAGAQEGVLGVDFDAAELLSLIANAKFQTTLMLALTLAVLLVSTTLISVLNAEVIKRKAVESSLKDTSGLLETILQKTTDFVYFKDVESRFLFFSDSFVKHCNLSNPDALRGKSDFDLFTKEHATPAFEAEREVIRTGKALINVEEKETHADGRITWVLTSKWPWYDKAGKVIGTWGISKEITEIRSAQEILHMLGSAVEQTTDSIIITDAQLDSPGPKILYTNPAFTKMTGYLAAEVRDKTPRILQGPRSDRTALAELKNKLGNGEVFSGEFINYRKDGSEFETEWEITPVRNADGVVCHFIAIQRDIAERKRFESNLIKTQKLETVGRLAGGIAHEFNNIMTVIIGHSDWLLGSLPGKHPLREHAEAIQKAADRAAKLTRQLTAYGRKQFLHAETLDLNSVLHGMNDMLRHIVPSNVELEIISCEGKTTVKADSGQLEQVIVNLVVNASDAMPHGGKLSLKTSILTQTLPDNAFTTELPSGRYVELSITDSGSGMTDIVKSRLFEPFFTTKDIGGGTGLGLAAAYGIIKQSGGNIEVVSQIGEGSCFKIYLPLFETPVAIAS